MGRVEGVESRAGIWVGAVGVGVEVGVGICAGVGLGSGHQWLGESGRSCGGLERGEEAGTRRAVQVAVVGEETAVGPAVQEPGRSDLGPAVPGRGRRRTNNVRHTAAVAVLYLT